MYGQDALASRSPRKLRTFFAENSLVKADADRVLLGIAARRGDTKIIIGPMGRQCFDLAGDPGERHSLATQSPCGEQRFEEVERWRKEMQVLGESLGEVGTGAIPVDREEQLRALGYLE
jgi:hypothetical protein